MRVKSLPTSGMLEQFPECGSVVSCCHHNLYQKHLLPRGHDCVLKAFLSYVACAAMWETASSMSVRFFGEGFQRCLPWDRLQPPQVCVYDRSSYGRLWSHFCCPSVGGPWTRHCCFFNTSHQLHILSLEAGRECIFFCQ